MPLSAIRKHPRAAYVAGTCLILLVITSALAASGQPSAAETAIFHWLNNAPAWLASVMRIITEAGSLPHSVLLWLLAAYLLAGRRATAELLVAGCGAAVAGQLAKIAVSRGRPEDFLQQLHLYAGHSDGFGFPSGHATFAAACATVLFLNTTTPYRIALVALGLIVGISRVYLGAHWPLDILGGWALGVICGIVVVYASRYALARRASNQTQS